MYPVEGFAAFRRRGQSYVSERLPVRPVQRMDRSELLPIVQAELPQPFVESLDGYLFADPVDNLLKRGRSDVVW